MSPPQLWRPEWFLRNVVDRRLMTKLGERIGLFYDGLFEEIVYRAHHNSVKVSYADTFFTDFCDYVVRACGLKRNFWRYLPESSTLRYMYERRKRYLRCIKRRGFEGDIRWSFDFWLSQSSFWYVTVKSFYSVWRKVVYENYVIPMSVSWEEGIALYIIYDFVKCFKNGGDRCVKKSFVKKYSKYVEIEKEMSKVIGGRQAHS